MKLLIFIGILFSILVHTDLSPNVKTQIVQLCLDKMHTYKHYDYLEQSNLILVKNNYTADLGNLHFGKKQIILVAVARQDIKPYASAKDVVDNKRHMIIRELIINDQTAKVTISLANVNQGITFNLIKKGIVWQVDTIQSWIS